MGTPEAEPFTVKPKQTYVPCGPQGQGRCVKPFVVWSVVGDKAEVWDPTGGQRMGGRRWVALRNLHASGKTATGKERRTGWRLHSDPPTDESQELCGSCMTWVGPDDLAVSAWGFGHSTCKPCKADIEQRYGC